jgi:hypothetical protein
MRWRFTAGLVPVLLLFAHGSVLAADCPTGGCGPGGASGYTLAAFAGLAVVAGLVKLVTDLMNNHQTPR